MVFSLKLSHSRMKMRLDGGITINLDHTYTHHAVVLMGDCIDVLHTIHY